MFLIIGVIGVVAIVAVAGYLILSNDDGEYDHYVGTYSVYQVSGSSGSTTFDGTMRIEIIEVNGTKITAVTTYDIYKTTTGVRTPFLVSNEKMTEDVSELDDLGVFQRSETLSTNWGTKGVDVFLEVVDGETTTSYVDQKNYDIAYKYVISMNGITLTFILSATSFI